jgi:hypothetical protein
LFGRLLDWIQSRKRERRDAEAAAALHANATHSVVLRLDPRAMENADLEVRWEIEKLLRAARPDLWFADDGFGYARHSDAIFLSYATNEPVRLVDALVDLLTNHTVLGNRLASAAMVAVAVRAPVVEAGRELDDHRVVYPRDQAGTPLLD